MSATFLPLTREHIPLALELMSQLYEQEHITYDAHLARLALEGLLDDPSAGGFWFMEEDERATAGYLAVLVCHSLEFGGRFALLDELYLQPSWRGRGLGRQALSFAENWCRSRQIGTLRLEVGPENAPALGLYSKSGFRVEERYLMTRRL